MWTKRFGVWCRTRQHGMARGVEEVPQQTWDAAAREGRAEKSGEKSDKVELHMVQPEPAEKMTLEV